MASVFHSRVVSGFMFFLGLFPAWETALAQDLPDGDLVVWHCWYTRDENHNIACRYASREQQLDPGYPEDEDYEDYEEDEAVDALPAFNPAPGHGLPQMVEKIWHQPKSLHGKRILTPLYSEPFDMESVEHLAHAVMCESRPTCKVIFGYSGPARTNHAPREY